MNVELEEEKDAAEAELNLVKSEQERTQAFLTSVNFSVQSQLKTILDALRMFQDVWQAVGLFSLCYISNITKVAKVAQLISGLGGVVVELDLMTDNGRKVHQQNQSGLDSTR